MFMIRLMQWPAMILMVAVVAMLMSAAAGVWFNTDEYVFHLNQ